MGEVVASGRVRRVLAQGKGQVVASVVAGIRGLLLVMFLVCFSVLLGVTRSSSSRLPAFFPYLWYRLGHLPRGPLALAGHLFRGRWQRFGMAVVVLFVPHPCGVHTS